MCSLTWVHLCRVFMLSMSNRYRMRSTGCLWDIRVLFSLLYFELFLAGLIRLLIGLACRGQTLFLILPALSLLRILFFCVGLCPMLAIIFNAAVPFFAFNIVSSMCCRKVRHLSKAIPNYFRLWHFPCRNFHYATLASRILVFGCPKGHDNSLALVGLFVPLRRGFTCFCTIIVASWRFLPCWSLYRPGVRLVVWLPCSLLR